MALRFETQEGRTLGMRFGGCRQHGLSFFLSEDEALLLFSLEREDKLAGESTGWTAGELMDLLGSGELTMFTEDMMRDQWGDSLGRTETFQGLDSEGHLQTGFRRS